MNNAIFVTGYFRSGTSALSGALNRLGVHFQNDIVPNKHNPIGFYETAELINFDEKIYASFDMDWSDIRNMPINWWIKPEMVGKIASLRTILQTNFTQPCWGIKHPYHCRLLPMYKYAVSAAPDTKIHNVNITRNPWFSAQSQMRKNNLSRTHSLLLWAIHVVEARKNTRDIPRSWTTYDRLLTNPLMLFKCIESEIGVRFFNFEEAANSIVPEMNHNNQLPKAGIPNRLTALVDAIWQAVENANFDENLWEDFQIEINEMVNLIVDMGKSARRFAPVTVGV